MRLMNLLMVGFFVICLGAAAAPDGELTGSGKTRLLDFPPPTFALEIAYTPIRYPGYSWAPEVHDGKSGWAVHLALEWLPLPPGFGKLGLGLGLGFYQISNVEVSETYEAQMQNFALDPFATYRFDYFTRQPVVPFVKVAFDYILSKQFATFGENPSPVMHRTYTGLAYGGGIELSLSALSQRSARNLYNSTGIKGTYAVVEWIKSQGLAPETYPDLSHEELRLGMRFEL